MTTELMIEAAKFYGIKKWHKLKSYQYYAYKSREQRR
jgi:hypothetical protein